MAFVPKFYWNKVCPFVQRSWITLVEKQVKAELVEVNLENMPQEFMESVNPDGTVPVLEIAPKRFVYESTYIAEYIDAHYEPKNSLFPRDPSVRAKMRKFMDAAGKMVGPLYGALRGKMTAAELQTHTQFTELVLKEVCGEGPFVLGAQFSLADIVVVPFLLRFSYTIPAFRGFNPWESTPLLRRMLTAARARQSVAETSMSGDFYVFGYHSYGGVERAKCFDLCRRSFKLQYSKSDIVGLAAVKEYVQIRKLNIELIEEEGSELVLTAKDHFTAPSSGIQNIFSVLEEMFPEQEPLVLRTDPAERAAERQITDNIMAFADDVASFLSATEGKQESAYQSVKDDAQYITKLVARISPKGAQGTGLLFCDHQVSAADIVLRVVLQRLLKDGATVFSPAGTFLNDFPRFDSFMKAK